MDAPPFCAGYVPENGKTAGFHGAIIPYLGAKTCGFFAAGAKKAGRAKNTAARLTENGNFGIIINSPVADKGLCAAHMRCLQN